MPIDVFGRPLENKKKELNRGPLGAGYKFTPDGDYDVDYKRLCNLASPAQPSDAVNLFTLTQVLEKYRKEEDTNIQDMLDDCSAINNLRRSNSLLGSSQ